MNAKHVSQLMLLGITIWLSNVVVPAEAQVDIQVGIQLPPPLVFSAPPQVIVLPETYVYVVPDIDEDVFSLTAVVASMAGALVPFPVL